MRQKAFIEGIHASCIIKTLFDIKSTPIMLERLNLGNVSIADEAGRVNKLVVTKTK